MAADGAFVPALARLHPRYQTPGARDRPAVGVGDPARAHRRVRRPARHRRLRRLDLLWPDRRRTVRASRRRLAGRSGFRTPGYPWLPAFFVTVAVVVVFSTIRTAPVRSLVGAGLLLLGIPVYYFFSGARRATLMLRNAARAVPAVGQDAPTRGDRSGRQQPRCMHARRSAGRARGRRPQRAERQRVCAADVGHRAPLRRDRRSRRHRPRLLGRELSRGRRARRRRRRGADRAADVRPAHRRVPVDGRARRAVRSAIRGRAGGSISTTIRQRLTPRTRLIIVTSPHNPTGVVIDRRVARRARAARAGRGRACAGR